MRIALLIACAAIAQLGPGRSPQCQGWHCPRMKHSSHPSRSALAEMARAAQGKLTTLVSAVEQSASSDVGLGSGLSSTRALIACVRSTSGGCKGRLRLAPADCLCTKDTLQL